MNLFLGLSLTILADPSAQTSGDSTVQQPAPLTLDVISVFGHQMDLSRVTGSAHLVNEKQLQRFEHDDVERVLSQVPGVYVRGEDGFGLRPNIGLRGAASDRSAKITLMEDGVLFGPAPYSAPAAYYFPLTTRMQAVEVFKGPSSILYGPNTIGGAINLVTADFPRGFAGTIDLAAGQFRYGKAHLRVGYGDPQFGALLEGVRLQSTGFKELDGGGDTGFGKNESMLKLRYVLDPDARVYQRFDLKFGYADETSNETYLGLSVEDFRRTPFRRYAASQLDGFESERTQAQLSYHLEVDDLDLSVTLYRHDFDRVWDRVGGFSGSAVTRSFNTVLRDSSAGFELLRRTLTGELNSTDPSSPLAGNLISQPSNGRNFVSQGAEARGTFRFDTGALSHEVTFGTRVHYDRIRRRQTESDFSMTNGVLVPLEGERVITHNDGRTWATAAYLANKVALFDLVLTPGVRAEFIRTEFIDQTPQNPAISSELTDANVVNQEYSVVIPGIGAYYEVFENFGVLGGMHRGFSPVAPGQAPEGAEIEPEDSINYEAGLRYSTRTLSGELIGFFSDYSNLLGNCTASAGCNVADIDRQFNAGQVWVYGLEARLSGTQPIGGGVDAVFEGSATLTNTEFQNDFLSFSPQFGDVQAGDFVPYVPRLQGGLTLGLSHRRIDVFASVTYIGEMLDQAAPWNDDAVLRTDEAFILDLSTAYRPSDFDTVYVKLNNALDERYIASYRPFGARPGRPLQFQAGYRRTF